MEGKNICSKLNPFRECIEYNLGLWECPGFLFLIMGLANIVAMVATYFVANRYSDQPEIVALIVIIISAIFLVISYSITQGFDKLAQANKMKTEFVSVASHQLRTPLSSMRWALNLLLDEHFQGSEQEKTSYLESVQESAERMIKLVNDLLDVSRIEMGRMIFAPRQTNLYIIAQKIIGSLTPYAKANNVALTLDAPETLPNVFTDPDRILLVVQNLIENAIKYTKGQGEVSVTMANDAKNVKVAIRDNGVGIPTSEQKYIFQKFFRSDNIMKHQTVGTGLGLFIAKSVVEESHGNIWFQSKEGLGSTFYFTLPIYK
ncbi:MAG TPA: hypothetical protein DHI91_00310 [Candidatus Portnoybacteria bacterium]|nr:hypothetical protein [Candidatus Portnoybacteria bacterium]